VTRLESFFAQIVPGPFAGIRLGDWIRILRRVRFSVDPRDWCRAGLITASAIPNSILARAETAIYRRAVAEAQIEQPLFIVARVVASEGALLKADGCWLTAFHCVAKNNCFILRRVQLG
jgi:hypothetical protein